jgi:hypothetical protein
MDWPPALLVVNSRGGRLVALQERLTELLDGFTKPQIRYEQRRTGLLKPPVRSIRWQNCRPIGARQ